MKQMNLLTMKINMDTLKLPAETKTFELVSTGTKSWEELSLGERVAIAGLLASLLVDSGDMRGHLEETLEGRKALRKEAFELRTRLKRCVCLHPQGGRGCSGIWGSLDVSNWRKIVSTARTLLHGIHL